jgi:cytochrome c556
MISRFVAAALAVSLGTIAVQLAAAPPAAKPNPRLAAVAHRQGEMKKLGGSLKAIAGFAQGANDDVGQLRRSAQTIQSVAAGMDRLFPAGTGVGVGKSRAKPVIWTERDAFRRRIVGLRTASAALAQAAATGDRDKVRPAFRATGAACKACHDFFQVPH